jgi:L-fuconolactonase
MRLAVSRIDAHHHFWHPGRGDYGWLTADLAICRPYGPADLAPHLHACGIDATVLVQAAPTLHETEYLLGVADTTAFVRGVVGWIDFENPDDRRHLERLAAHPKLVGVRPMIQDIADDGWMLRPDISWAFAATEELGLAFDALVFPRHLPRLARLLEQHPGLTTVIDHGAKPSIREGRFDDWAVSMTRLARDTAAFCKLSGLATEAGPSWTIETLRPYVDHLFAAFGARRVMFGSDWPVSTLVTGYQRWVEAVDRLASGLSAEEQTSLFGGTAVRAYRLHRLADASEARARP